MIGTRERRGVYSLALFLFPSKSGNESNLRLTEWYNGIMAVGAAKK